MEIELFIYFIMEIELKMELIINETETNNY